MTVIRNALKPIAWSMLFMMLLMQGSVAGADVLAMTAQAPSEANHEIGHPDRTGRFMLAAPQTCTGCNAEDRGCCSSRCTQVCKRSCCGGFVLFDEQTSMFSPRIHRIRITMDVTCHEAHHSDIFHPPKH